MRSAKIAIPIEVRAGSEPCGGKLSGFHGCILLSSVRSCDLGWLGEDDTSIVGYAHPNSSVGTSVVSDLEDADRISRYQNVIF